MKLRFDRLNKKCGMCLVHETVRLPSEPAYKAMTLTFLIASQGLPRAMALSSEQRLTHVRTVKKMWCKSPGYKHPRPEPWIAVAPSTVAEFQRTYHQAFDRAFPDGSQLEPLLVSEVEWLGLFSETRCRGRPYSYVAVRQGPSAMMMQQSAPEYSPPKNESQLAEALAGLTQLVGQLVGARGGISEEVPLNFNVGPRRQQGGGQLQLGGGRGVCGDQLPPLGGQQGAVGGVLGDPLDHGGALGGPRRDGGALGGQQGALGGALGGQQGALGGALGGGAEPEDEDERREADGVEGAEASQKVLVPHGLWTL